MDSEKTFQMIGQFRVKLYVNLTKSKLNLIECCEFLII